MYIKTMCLLFLITTQVNGTSLSRLFQDPEVFNPNDYDMGFGGNQPVLINDRILFAGRTLNGSALWALDINTLEKIEILQGFNSRVDFIRLGDQLFFKFNTDFSSGEVIWQTDGTVIGTKLFYSGKNLDNLFDLKKSGSVFYTKTRDNELLVSDGNQVVIHSIDPLYNEEICAFSADKVVVYNMIDNTPQYRWSNGSEAVVLGSPLGEFTGFRPQVEVVPHNGSCYVIAPVSGSDRGGGVYEIDDAGQISPVPTPSELGIDILQIISHQNRLYARNFISGSLEHSVYRLSEDLLTVDTTLEVGDTPLMFSIGPYLALMFHPPVSPPIISIDFVNADLSLTGGFISDFQTTSTPFPPLFYPVSDKWLMARPFRVGNNDDIKSVVLSPFVDDEITLQLPESNNHKVITSKDSDRVFLLSTDKEARSVLNEVVSTPKISSLIDGSWIEPNIKDQGLMLRTGKRQNGSEYLIATIYTYNNGEQLWLAGNIDIELNMESIELPVFTYEGLDFFEAEFDAERIPFGSLKMQLTSCQTMDMELQTPLGTQTHTLFRIDDTTATEFCVD